MVCAEGQDHNERSLLMSAGGSQALTELVELLLHCFSCGCLDDGWCFQLDVEQECEVYCMQACTNTDARRRPKNTGEILCLQHSDSGGEKRMSQLSSRHGPKWRE